MMNNKVINSFSSKIATVVILLVLLSFIVPRPKITVWLIGDSTMSNKEAKAYPETGWGMELASFFDNSITVENKALNGRSTKSFINENHWQPVLDHIKTGDYVFIEFGHNDEKIDKPTIGTTIEEFKTNLVKYVVDTRQKGGIPILLTPITRRSFKNGVLKYTHGLYPAATKAVADSLKVPLIDLLTKSKMLVENMGDDSSRALYNYVDTNNINYPNGKKDDTHLSPVGAKKIASLAAEGIEELKLELSRRLLKHLNKD